jgi:hypothetical protein
VLLSEEVLLRRMIFSLPRAERGAEEIQREGDADAGAAVRLDGTHRGHAHVAVSPTPYALRHTPSNLHPTPYTPPTGRNASVYMCYSKSVAASTASRAQVLRVKKERSVTRGDEA